MFYLCSSSLLVNRATAESWRIVYDSEDLPCISEGGQYFHMNWGWGPGYNNWCVAGDFTGDGTRYNNWLRILVNVRP